MAKIVETATLVAEATGTTWARIEQGPFNVSISGLVDSIVTFERSFDGGTTPLVVDTFNADVEEAGWEPEGCWYRLYIQTGDYGTDDVICRVSQWLRGYSAPGITS